MKYFNIPIFVPHEGCPFDCIFCNQRKITGADTSITKEEVKNIIDEHLKTLPKEDRHIEVAFFGGSFTGISKDKQEEFLKIANEYLSDGRIDGIRLSTRPDFISEEILTRLKKYGVTTIELGVQSMCDDVLIKATRGHTKEDVIKSARLIKAYGISLGLQMMTGLPGDTQEKSIKTAEEIIKLKPACVRIYPTLVLLGTGLLEKYEKGEYAPQELEDAVDLCKKLLVMFRNAKIPVIRTGLATTDEICEGGAIVAGPYHPAFRELTEGEIYFDEIEKIIAENKEIESLLVNPGELSKAIGNGKKNIKRIREKYGIEIKIIPDDTIEKGTIKIGRNEF